MTPLICFGIALYSMGSDARQTYWAKIHYNWQASLFWSLLWPLTAILSIYGVITRNH